MSRSRACVGLGSQDTREIRFRMDCLLGWQLTKGTTCTNTRQAILSTITAAPLRAGFRAALTAFIVKSPLYSNFMY
jgi:hypothetical protein